MLYIIFMNFHYLAPNWPTLTPKLKPKKFDSAVITPS